MKTQKTASRSDSKPFSDSPGVIVLRNRVNLVRGLEDARIAAWDSILKHSGPGRYVELRYLTRDTVKEAFIREAMDYVGGL